VKLYDGVGEKIQGLPKKRGGKKVLSGERPKSFCRPERGQLEVKGEKREQWTAVDSRGVPE